MPTPSPIPTKSKQEAPARGTITVAGLNKTAKSVAASIQRYIGILVALVLVAALGYGALTVSSVLETASTPLEPSTPPADDYSLIFDTTTRKKIDELANKKNTPVTIPTTGRINPFSE